MNDQDGNTFLRPQKFSSSALPLIYIWLTTVEVLCVVLATIAMKRGEIVACVFVSACFLILGSIGVISIAGASDIVVDGNGISRVFLGKTWQSFSWSHIRKIVSFGVSNEHGGKVRSFGIHAQQTSQDSLIPLRVMAFNEKINNVRELIEAINRYVAKHGIEVETTVDGIKKSVDHL